METLFIICLLVGGLYSVVSLLFSGFLDGLDLDFEFDFGVFSLPIKPFTVMVFITAFGGVGWLSTKYINPWLSLIPAVIAGLVTSFLLYRYFFQVIRSYEIETARESDALMLRAEVVERIPPGGYGKISYVIDSNIVSGPAKEKKAGFGIAKGAMVYILAVNDNVYYVCEDIEAYLSGGE